MANNPFFNESFMDETRTVEQTNPSGAVNYDTNFDFYKANTLSGKKDKEELQNRVKNDVVKMINLFEKMFFPTWIQAYKDYTLSTLDRQLDLEKK